MFISEPRSRKKLGLTILGIAAAAITADIGSLAYSLATAEKRMTRVCAEIKPGLTIDDLNALADRDGLGPHIVQPTHETAYLVEARTFGRYGCRVNLKAGVVVQASYSYSN